MREPTGPLAEHKFKKTTVIGNSVFFAGKAHVPVRLIEEHKRNEAAAARRKAEELEQIGKTAGELLAHEETDDEETAATNEKPKAPGTDIPPVNAPAKSK